MKTRYSVNSASQPLLKIRDDVRMGFGTATPSTFVDFVNPSYDTLPAGDAKVRVKANSTTSWARLWTENDANNFAEFGIASTQNPKHVANAGFIFTSKRVPAQYYHVNDSVGFHAFEIGNSNDDVNSGTEVMRIMKVSATDGRVGIGTGTIIPSEALEVNGNIQAWGWNSSSDRRLKTNIDSIGNALKMITQLRGVYYKIDTTKIFPVMQWKIDSVTLDTIYYHAPFDTSRKVGFLAQDVEKVLPEAVSINDSGYWVVPYLMCWKIF